MKIITAPETYKYNESDIKVFLAGGITNCPDWQSKVINYLNNIDFDLLSKLVVFNPRRKDFPIHDKSAAFQQIEWEYNMLEKCDIFSIYFSSGESDQPICMYELGRNILRMQMKYPVDWQDRIIISVEDGYRRKQDVLIQTGLATQNMISINTQISPSICLEEHVDNIIRKYYTISKKVI